jgi:hypothetical protein
MHHLFTATWIPSPYSFIFDEDRVIGKAVYHGRLLSGDGVDVASDPEVRTGF